MYLHLFPFLCLMKIVNGLYFMNFVFNEVFPSPDDDVAVKMCGLNGIQYYMMAIMQI